MSQEPRRVSQDEATGEPAPDTNTSGVSRRPFQAAEVVINPAGSERSVLQQEHGPMILEWISQNRRQLSERAKPYTSPELPSNSHNEAPRESGPGKNMSSIGMILPLTVNRDEFLTDGTEVRPLAEKNPEGISEHRRWDDDLARTAESFAAAEAATRILQLRTTACTGMTQSPVSKGPANGAAGAQRSTNQLDYAKQPSHWVQESPELFQTKRIKRAHPRSGDHDDSSGERTVSFQIYSTLREN